jgi:glutathione S-transferase
MLRLLIANRTYSSWSLRGWLVAKLSGLPFEAELLPLDTPEFAGAAADPARLPSGKVPTLWDGPVAVWDSLAILSHLEERCGTSRFWPADGQARAHARSGVAEMHSGFMPLRRACPMHLKRRLDRRALAADVEADVERVDRLWCEARSRFGSGGDFLYGAFSAADAFWAPVATRAITYDLPLSPAAAAYRDAIVAHPWMVEWREGAEAEEWIVARLEPRDGA